MAEQVYERMNEREMEVLEQQLKGYPIHSLWSLFSFAAEELMQLHQMVHTGTMDAELKEKVEAANGRLEVMQRAYIAIVGYMGDVLMQHTPAEVTVAYQSFDTPDGNQLEKIIISSGAYERAELKKWSFYLKDHIIPQSD
jgi:hypothetical protein